MNSQRLNLFLDDCHKVIPTRCFVMTLNSVSPSSTPAVFSSNFVSHPSLSAPPGTPGLDVSYDTFSQTLSGKDTSKSVGIGGSIFITVSAPVTSSTLPTEVSRQPSSYILVSFPSRLSSSYQSRSSEWKTTQISSGITRTETSLY